MNTKLKASIIHKFTSDHYYNKDYADFFEFNDLGVPLADSVFYGLCEPTDEGTEIISMTYELLCDELDKDSNQEYANVNEYFESPGE
jgi:hypothetical protein